MRVMDFSYVEPSEIIFNKKLFSSRFSEIFLVKIRGTTCVMKVHHGRGPIKYTPPGRETDIHICEATAYRRLREHGICDRGIVPRFYGTIEKLDWSRYQPHLNMFAADESLPSAIFLEYIPNMEPVYPENYTKKRADGFIRGIQEIHKALILHTDAKPRNMMIIKDDPERVVWLDFDRAQTYHAESITERQKVFIEEEELMVSQFMDSLKLDHQRGEINETYLYYCT